MHRANNIHLNLKFINNLMIYELFITTLNHIVHIGWKFSPPYIHSLSEGGKKKTNQSHSQIFL